MQTDTWLTDTVYPDRCPLCSQPLVGGSSTCSSCGFTGHEPAGNPARPFASRQPNPITPIPARASARRTQSRPGTASRRAVSDAVPSSTRFPAEAPKGGSRKHESPSYEAASSLTSLSLLISETPTAPPRVSRSTERLEYIDEIDTVPQPSGCTRVVQLVPDQAPLASSPLPEAQPPLHFDDLAVPELAAFLPETISPTPFSHIDEIDTVPEIGSSSTRAVASLRSTTREVAVDAASWTAGPGATSSLAARLIASRSPRQQRRRRLFNPFDRARWWLLRPGRIEFLLWTVGSLLLFGVTFLLLLATILSVIVPGLQVSGNFPTSTVSASAVSRAGTSAVPNDLHLTLSGKSLLAPGAEMHLQGTGFHAQSKVVFLLDGRLPLLDQRDQAASIQTDASGHFAVKLWLGQGAAWSAGSHALLAREIASGHQVTIAITITAVLATPGTGNAGVQHTPVPPVNPTPTPTPVPPTPTAQPPVATPTTGTPLSPVPPPAAPIRGTTATPTSTSTPDQGSVGDSSSLGNALNSEDGSHSLLGRLVHLNPLVWLIGVCYFISMLLLGLAGLLRRRR